jgi:hypothetical protein
MAVQINQMFKLKKNIACRSQERIPSTLNNEQHLDGVKTSATFFSELIAIEKVLET